MTGSIPSPASVPRGAHLDSHLLLPALALSGLIVLLCDWVSLSLPLHGLVITIWIVAPFALLAWVCSRGQLLVRRAHICVGLIAALTIWLVLFNISGRWNPAGLISYHPDAWSYGALADYFANYRRGFPPLEMPMIAQFSSHLRDTRFASSALLVFLKAAPGVGEATSLHLCFYVVCLGVHFFTLAYFVRGLVASYAIAIAGAVLGTAGGWLANAITVGNYDTLVFVSLVPAWLGIVVRFQRGTITTRRFMLAGSLLLAALFEIYPEGFALLGILLLPLLLHVLLRMWRRPVEAWSFAAMGAFSLLLVLPYLPICLTFFRQQLATSSSIRPGAGNFTGLLGAHWLPGAFALGEELSGASFQPANLLLPIVFCICAAAGVLALRKTHRWFPWVLIPLLGLAIWQGWEVRYDYGLYKVLLSGSWWIYPSVAVGFWHLTSRFGRAQIPLATLAVGLVSGLAWEKAEDFPSRVWPGDYSLRPLEELTGIDHVIGDEPLLLDIDNDFEYLWSTLFLRSHRLASTRLRSYYAMAHIRLTNLPKPEECRYVLVSGERPEALWKNSRFSLLLNNAARVTGIENPNGLETLEHEPFFWLNSHDTTLTITAMESGEYALCATQLLAGPSAPQTGSKRRVLVTDVNGSHELSVSPGSDALANRFPVHLERGENHVTVRGLDAGTVTRQPNGDTRELLLGWQGLSIGKISSAVDAKTSAPSPW